MACAVRVAGRFPGRHRGGMLASTTAMSPSVDICAIVLRGALGALIALALALPGVAEGAVFAPPPGAPATTAPTTTTPPAPAPAATAPAKTPAPKASGAPHQGAAPTTPTNEHGKGKAPGAQPSKPAPSQPTTSAPVRTVTSNTPAASSESSGSSTTLLILALVAAVALLIGIAFMILRDAHGVAPVSDGPVEGSATRNPAGRVRKRRAKTKAARIQRRRNR
jgi:hypothetical protein